MIARFRYSVGGDTWAGQKQIFLRTVYCNDNALFILFFYISMMGK